MQCPQCSQVIEQDFGVITCQNCGAVLMIDIDGNVQVSEPSSADSSSSSSSKEIPSSSDSESIVDFQDVIEFANSELTSGPLSYTLVIQGIDNAELKDKVKETLQDQKLKLNVEELLNSITNGKLELKNLNPIKTSLIVQRLGEEKLQIYWSQHAY